MASCWQYEACAYAVEFETRRTAQAREVEETKGSQSRVMVETDNFAGDHSDTDTTASLMILPKPCAWEPTTSGPHDCGTSRAHYKAIPEPERSLHSEDTFASETAHVMPPWNYSNLSNSRTGVLHVSTSTGSVNSAKSKLRLGHHVKTQHFSTSKARAGAPRTRPPRSVPQPCPPPSRCPPRPSAPPGGSHGRPE